MSPSSTSLRFVFCWASWLLLPTAWRPATCWASWLLLKTREAVAVYFLAWCLEKPYAAAATRTKHSRIHGARRRRTPSTCSKPRFVCSASIQRPDSLHRPRERDPGLPTCAMRGKSPHQDYGRLPAQATRLVERCWIEP